MGEVVDIKTGLAVEAEGPHLTLQTIDGKVRIIPVSVFRDIIEGRMPVTDMDDWDIIVRTALAIIVNEAVK